MYFSDVRKSFLGAVAIILLLPVFSFAQELPQLPDLTELPPELVVLADIAMTDIVLEPSTDSSLGFSFNLKNLHTKPEFNMRFGIELIPTDGEPWEVYDSKVFPEQINLSSQQELSKIVKYDISNIAPGSYSALLKITNSAGVVLSNTIVSNIDIAGTEGVSIVSSECKVVIEGDENTFDIFQGVDVNPEEIVKVICPAKNFSKVAVTLSPSFTHFERSRYGEVVSVIYPTAEMVTLQVNEEREVAFLVTKPDRPQAYDLSIALKDSATNKVVSNSIDFHYVLRGTSATIQKASIDKLSYKVGETANIDISWTPSADGFGLSSRFTDTSIENISVRVELSSGGVLCAESFTSKLSDNPTEPLEKSTMSITNDCAKPKLKVELLSESGAVLALSESQVTDSMMGIEEEVESENEQVAVSEIEVKDESNALFYFVSTAISLLLILLVFLLARKRVSKNVILKSFIFVIAIFSVYGLPNVDKVEAVSFWSACHYSDPDGGGDRCLYFNVNANLNSTAYTPSSVMTLTTSMSNSYCSNLDIVKHYYYYVIYNSGGSAVSSGVISAPSGNTHFYTQAKNITAPSVPGYYTMRLVFALYNSSGAATAGDIGFNVVCPGGTTWNGSSCAVPPPAAPASISATCPAVGGNPVAISWPTSVGSTHYAFRLDYPSDPAPHLVQLDSHVPSSYNSFVPSDGVAYRAWVHACNAGGCSALVSTDFTCRFAPAVTLTASPTLIGEGESSTLTWTATGADTCTASGAWSGVKTNTGGSQSVSPMVSSTYNLSCTGSGGTTPVSVTVTMPSGTISATACTIPVAGSSCTSNITWNTQNFRGTPSILQGNAPFSSAVSATAVPRQVNPGDRTFTVKDTGSLYTYGVNAVVNCAANSAWAGGSCMQLPVIDIVSNPNIVRSGNTAPVDISILSNYNLTCELTGGIQETFTHTASATTQNYTYTTPPLTSARVVHIKCTHDTYSAVTTEDEARIDVIPTVQEV